VFLDGDCLAPADHIAQYLKHRGSRSAMAGFCYYLDQRTSDRIDELVVRTGAFERWATTEQKRNLARMDRKARLYSLIRHPRRPKLYGDVALGFRGPQWLQRRVHGLGLRG
jgi:hypothetical protein